MALAETALRAGSEAGDLVALLLDETDNKEQVAVFVKEGMETFNAVVALLREAKEAGDSNKLAKLVAHLAVGFGSKMIEGPLAFAPSE